MVLARQGGKPGCGGGTFSAVVGIKGRQKRHARTNCSDHGFCGRNGKFCACANRHCQFGARLNGRAFDIGNCRHGRPFVYKVIVIAAVLNLAVLLAFKHLFGPALVEALQFSGYSWLYEGFNTLLGNTYRVFIASFIAIILAETADTEVYHRLRHRSWLTRVLGSNAISIPVDTVLFYCIAFVGVANWSLEMLGAAIFGEIIIKYVIGFAYGLTGEGIRSKSDSLDMDKALS